MPHSLAGERDMDRRTTAEHAAVLSDLRHPRNAPSSLISGAMQNSDLVGLFAAHTEAPTDLQRQWLRVRGVPEHVLSGRWPGPLAIGKIVTSDTGMFRFASDGRRAAIWPARAMPFGDVVDLVAFDPACWSAWTYLSRSTNGWWIACRIMAEEGTA